MLSEIRLSTPTPATGELPNPSLPPIQDIDSFDHKSDATIFFPSINTNPERSKSWQNVLYQITDSRLNDRRYSIAEQITVKMDTKYYQGRGLACLCDRGKMVSLTMRSPKYDDEDPNSILFPCPHNRNGLKEKFKAKAKDGYVDNGKNNWFSIHDQVTVLDKEIFNTDDHHPHGLIVLCGSTNSAKSLIARGLIHCFLEREVTNYFSSSDKRRPHLVTFEDPIETFFVESTDPKNIKLHPELAKLWGIDYTPREKGKDVRDLDQAFEDALRQTPKVFFIGEVRQIEDWKKVLDFAGTGHLVITTAHAGSLIEMYSKILSAVDANTPAKRQFYASKVKAIVHMKSVGEVKGRSLLLPSLWRQTPRGLAGLTTNGLNSIISASVCNVDESCLGRYALIQNLINVSSQKPNDDEGTILFKTALALDLGSEGA